MPIENLWLLRLIIVSIARHNFTLPVAVTTLRRLVDNCGFAGRNDDVGKADHQNE